MAEIYFIDEFLVRATSWKNAFKTMLKYQRNADKVLFKAIDAMDGLDEIIEIVERCTDNGIESVGIIKEYHSFNDWREVHEEDFDL